jgi:hypothetical protein
MLLLPFQKCTWHVLFHIGNYNRACSSFGILETKMLWLFALNVAEYSLRQETLLEL